MFCFSSPLPFYFFDFCPEFCRKSGLFVCHTPVNSNLVVRLFGSKPSTLSLLLLFWRRALYVLSTQIFYSCQSLFLFHWISSLALSLFLLSNDNISKHIICSASLLICSISGKTAILLRSLSEVWPPTKRWEFGRRKRSWKCGRWRSRTSFV